MFRDPGRTLVLVLDGGRLEALGRLLRALRPRLRVEHVPFPARHWMSLLEDPEAGGLVAPVDLMGRGDLVALEAVLGARPRLEALLLVGERGLAGCEDLLGLPNAALLPEPWTAAALERLVGLDRPEARPPEAVEAAPPPRIPAPAPPPRVSPAPPALGEPPSPSLGEARAVPAPAELASSGAGPFPAPFVAAAIEGLRDPLASVSGYLQLLRGRQGPEEGQLLNSALAAARELDRLLEAWHHATETRRPRSRRVDLRQFGLEALENAGLAGAPDYQFQGQAEVEADPRLLHAALYVARLYLERFGPGGQPALRGRGTGAGSWLAWELSPPAAPPPGPLAAPSPFFPGLLERLSRLLSARPLLDRVREAIPVRAGLFWEPGTP